MMEDISTQDQEFVREVTQLQQEELQLIEVEMLLEELCKDDD